MNTRTTMTGRKDIGINMNSIFKMDCLKLMPKIKDKSIDLIIADLPYGTTKNEWDNIIPFKQMWKQFNRIIKDNGVILLFAQPPFNIKLAASNMEMYRYDWVWEKTCASGFLNASKMPLKAHEYILVFYKKLPTYNPQKTKGHKKEVSKESADKCIMSSNYGKSYKRTAYCSDERYPRSVLKFSSDKQFCQVHPTQKPVKLIEYFIKTYTNPGDIIFDPTAGSGTTGVVCENLGDRQYILCEKYDINAALKRISEAKGQVGLFNVA